ncbi:MAG: hypothetical protein KGI35_03670, partial [Burkholderiales bacterium]|nr:hypothetical protein [Burkholderiales bacterium]
MSRLLYGPLRARRETRSRRASVALCALMLAASVWALARWTHGFEVWTHEGRRALAIEAGSLRAADVALVGSDGLALRPWNGGAGAPARAYLVDWIYLDCPGVCRA